MFAELKVLRIESDRIAKAKAAFHSCCGLGRFGKPGTMSEPYSDHYIELGAVIGRKGEPDIDEDFMQKMIDALVDVVEQHGCQICISARLKEDPA
jgi:hypothetical protein